MTNHQCGWRLSFGGSSIAVLDSKAEAVRLQASLDSAQAKLKELQNDAKAFWHLNQKAVRYQHEPSTLSLQLRLQPDAAPCVRC